MKNQQVINVALIGNPNTGKTSLFNQLTGLNQKVGNYPGVTVDKKEGFCQLTEYTKATITDFPGTYSINPTSIDESIVLKSLLNYRDKKIPNVIAVVAEIENLKRNLLLFSQIKDLKIPTVLVINMADQMKRKGIHLDLELLKKELRCEVVLTSIRKDKKESEELMKKAIIQTFKSPNTNPLCDVKPKIDPSFFEKLKQDFSEQTLVETGLFYLDEKKKIYIERFRGRLIFPINNISGQPIALGGRIIENLDY